MWLHFFYTNINLAVESCDIAHQFNKVVIYNHGSGVLLYALNLWSNSCIGIRVLHAKLIERRINWVGLLISQILECSKYMHSIQFSNDHELKLYSVWGLFYDRQRIMWPCFGQRSSGDHEHLALYFPSWRFPGRRAVYFAVLSLLEHV